MLHKFAMPIHFTLLITETQGDWDLHIKINQSINQSKRKTSYAKSLLKSKQHTTPDELELHNPMQRTTGHIKHCSIELKPDAKK